MVQPSFTNCQRNSPANLRILKSKNYRYLYFREIKKSIILYQYYTMSSSVQRSHSIGKQIGIQKWNAKKVFENKINHN